MQIEIKSLVICYPGDDTVGMPSRYYELTGPFQFEDDEALKEFKEKLSEAFEYVEDGKPRDIVTNRDYERWEAGEDVMDKELQEFREDFYREEKDDELYFL